MKRALGFLCCLLFISCNKADSNINKLSGNYMGYFHRDYSDTAQVSLYFSDNTYQGESDSDFYPAIGKGTFEQKENTVTFFDSCRWNTAFDGSLLLNGSFSVYQNNDGTLRIWREKGGITDEYILGQVVR